MGDLKSVNLIDLSSENDNPCSLIQIESENFTQPYDESQTLQKGESLENNPFDSVQKLVDRVDDPFDRVEKEASLKAQEVGKTPTEVLLGNLLSLSDDNLLNDELKSETSSFFKKELSTIMKDLDLESPPVTFHGKQTPDSVSAADSDSNPNSSTDGSASAKLKKKLGYHKRLLKLSLSNAAYNSPLARKRACEFDDILDTPVSSMLPAATEYEDKLLAAESPLKLVEDEEFTSRDPPNFIDSEKMFETDLEMLRIPMLNELNSPVSQQISMHLSLIEVDEKKSNKLEDNLPNVETIKAKLKAKNSENNGNHKQEISSLIQNLKNLISNGAMIDTVKKQQASDLLESLSSALRATDTEELLPPAEMLLSPQSIKREGTFDMDLLEKQGTDVANQPLMQEIHNCMVSSSATYDGEPRDEYQELNLPEIEPVEFRTSPSQCLEQEKYHNKEYTNHLRNDVNDVMEHLSQLLINSTADDPASSNNPTYIVVMNANQFNQSNFYSPPQKSVLVERKVASANKNLQNFVNNETPNLRNVDPITRRRSQSLSIHDKINIVQLPHLISQSKQKQSSVQLDESQPITITPPSINSEVPEFKTPARIIRRNSYSSGTPFTAQVGMKQTRIGLGNNSHIQQRKSVTTHREREPQVNVKRVSMPQNNLPKFKSDLKKRQNTESIMKSSGPLKATIPVKKVAPTFKTSPPTPESCTRLNMLHNMSLQNQSKKSKVPITPLRAKGTSTLGVGVDYPNACSTPTPFSPPLRRTMGPNNKPRYTYMSATPNPKSSVTCAATQTSLKKRRTITEFKAKSPLKPRVSSSALLPKAAVATATARTSTVPSRLSTSAEARVLKTPVGISTANKVKPTSRLSLRVSVGGSIASSKSKENKHP